MVSLFLALPGEIRSQVYDYVLPDIQRITFVNYLPGGQFKLMPTPNHHHALPCVSRLFRSETRMLELGSYLFIIKGRDAHEAAYHIFPSWLRLLGPNNCTALGNLDYRFFSEQGMRKEMQTRIDRLYHHGFLATKYKEYEPMGEEYKPRNNFRKKWVRSVAETYLQMGLSLREVKIWTDGPDGRRRGRPRWHIVVCKKPEDVAEASTHGEAESNASEKGPE
ncbi:hypothetical protein EJ03DRAFT_348162 [Teratosphaeria nubilosa]|uniref:Uncharacterized protein n=1 Tax=Teratosphaeria nubilosa TaxID=161662 RepID=A0A6G1LKI2_9PEZI|nr:hypothetical protein EJ03DRAFT_348162 [Teratosphaeria nubilosa]